ncbi:heterokaryon incompatibility protein-domain-containing protein [Hypoxylon sp. FL1284]|nr:heterokaryon incompatibility protein-domain-containing protein [Hypoxylon sp. FL1284]
MASPTTVSPAHDKQNSRYSHYPLQRARDIRLVRILPRIEDGHGFELELSATSLDEPIPYIALSYTWDAAELDMKTGTFEPAPEFEVECHGGRLTVMENLFDFLRHARQNADISKYYWIDQICINQADLAERSRQVAMMGSVYKAAREVHVWLGKNNPSPEFLWVCKSFIPRILRLDSEMRERGASLGFDSWDCRTPDTVQGLGAAVCERWQQSYESFFTFFYARRWFLRAWILQEVTLKDPSRVQVFCGEEEFSWEMFDSFMQFVERSSWHHSLPALYLPWSKTFGGPMVPLMNLLRSRRYIDLQARGGRELEDWKANFAWDIGPQDNRQIWYSILLHFLRCTRPMLAKDPRDHIYSLLGMMEEFLLPGMECPITPNYEAAPVDVFRDVATQIFQNTPSLYLLSTISYGICDPYQGIAWPSWVPNFSNDSFFIQSLSTTAYLVSSGKQNYNSSKIDTIRYQPPIIRDGILTVYGAQIGTVGKCSDRRRVISGSENLPFLHFILELCAQGEAEYPSPRHTWIEAVWRTLLADCIPADLDTPPPVLFRSWLLEHIVRAIKFKGSDYNERHRESELLLTDLLERISSDPHLSLALPTWGEVSRKTSGYISRDHVEEHPFELLPCESSRTRRLYLTISGYLGFGPNSVSEGDEIWLLTGGKMPFILRRIGPVEIV